MNASSVIDVLLRQGHRDTQPRRAVIAALAALPHPATPAEIEAQVQKAGGSANTVTVYRVLELLSSLKLLHRHPSSGRVSLCQIPDVAGDHGFMHCSDCGHTEEFCSGELEQLEDGIAQRSGFRPHTHLHEIIGTCSHCS